MDMTDELTPEEREALANLPRERMPSAGLEDRVVAAMRERGHLSRKPARVIRLSTSRVAGLLAACLVLMIGAYSIGLHNGISNEVLRKVEPTSSALSTEPAREEEQDLGVKPPAATESPRRDQAEPATAAEHGFVDKKAPPFEPKLNTPQLVAPKDAKRKAERAKEDELTENMAKSFTDRLSSAADVAAPAPASKSAAPMQLQSNIAANESPATWRTFVLNGGTLIVDAPDSLRIVQDEQGRTLLIYTSDGVIRIRLAD
jgi:hypothetical protein